jgi:hypothetical protein
MRRTQPRLRVLKALVEAGGTISDPKGLVFRQIATDLDITRVSAASICEAMERDGLVERKSNGNARRTYAISITGLGRIWLGPDTPVMAEPEPEPEVFDEPTPEAVETVVEAAKAAVELDYRVLASELLGEMAARLAHPVVETDHELCDYRLSKFEETSRAKIDEVERNLARATEYGQTQQRRVQDLQTKLTRAETTIEDLRKQLKNKPKPSPPSSQAWRKITDIKGLLSYAQDMGCTTRMNGGNHYRCTTPGGAQLTFPGTPSDTRSVKNCVADLRRALAREQS